MKTIQKQPQLNDKKDLSQLKQSLVHSGLLEVLLLSNTVRKKINKLIKDEEITGFICHDKLIEMSYSICDFENDLGDLIGSILSTRLDEGSDRQGIFPLFFGLNRISV